MDLSEPQANERAPSELPPPPLMRAIRQRAGVTQRRLADELGVSQPAVSRYELGIRSCRGELASRYAELLRQLQEALA